MIRCPKCDQVHAINRSGKVHGVQRYYCKECQVHFTLKPASAGKTESISPRKRSATIADIAKALNISKSTVSRALHEHKDINTDTRRAVLDMARQLDYTPNLLAQSLVRSKSNTIGIIVPELLTYFFPTVIIGATEVATNAGYTVVICQSQESLKTEIANVNVLLASRVDGVLISITKNTGTYDHFRSFERHDIPMVFYNRICEDINSPRVLVNDYDGAFKATEHLVNAGYTRIAHIAGPPSLRLSNNRLNGYRDALKKYKLPFKKNFVLHTNLTVDDSRRCAAKILSMKEKPDAVFCVNDPTAIQLILLAKEKGVAIPGQLGVVGFSNDPMAAVIEPGLTTVAQPVAELGRRAMDMLIKRIEQGNSHTDEMQTEYLQTELIVRASSTRVKRS